MVDSKSKKFSFKNWKGSLEIFKYIKSYKITYVFGLICLFGSSLSAMIFPYLLGNLLGANSLDKNDEFNIFDSNNINALFLLLMLLFTAQAIFSFLRIYFFGIVTEKALKDIRKDTFNKLITMPISFFDQNKVGELQSRVSSDIVQLTETFNTTLAEFLRQIFTIIFGISFIAFISWKLSLIMLAIVPVIAVSAVIFGRFIKKLSKNAQESSAESNNILLEALSGIRNVKTFANEFFENNKYQFSIAEIEKLGIKGAVWRGLFASFIIIAMFGSIIFVIWNGMKMVNNGELNNQEFFQFILYTIMIGASFGGVSSLLGSIQKALGATERILEILKMNAEPIKSNNEPIEKLQIKGELSFKNVGFSYQTRPDITVLKNISFEIASGKQTAIVGASGAGKSTIANLLLRFYEPSSGSISIDKINYLNFPLSSLRAEIAIVPQEVFLFGGTIYENISYGKSSATEKEIYSAAKKANALEFIEKFPDKMETLVGDRGIQLSGGQKQRIAIARAILKNPKILILDEATSSLDSESEKYVQEALNYLMQGRTSIVIAHRLTTIKKADNILVIKNGVIFEKGKHDELISKNGVYAHLTNLQ
jgi:ABC-type multidrug transport system fused ATPase/permease subunit